MSEQQPLYPHVAARLFNQPLLIEPGKLHAIAHGLSTRFGVELHGLPPADSQLLAPREQSEPKKPYQVINGIGVIPVFNTLVHRSGWMDAMSGLTSYEQIGKLFDVALADDDVSSLLLHIDSPGGEAKGVFDLADKILNAQTDKPVIAFADMATSAAYLIGSAADQFFASQSAPLGSIGVRMLHVDQSRMNDARGLTVTELYYGARKIDGTPHQPLTEEMLTTFQARLKDVGDLFVSAVARNRSLAWSAVRDTEAAVYMGAKAISLGLVDGVRTLDQLLAQPVIGTAATVPQLNSDERRTEDMEKFDNVAALAAAYPELAAEIRTEAVTAERARIKKILTLAPRGQEQLAQKLAFETDTAPGMAAEQFLEAQQAGRKSQLEAFTKDAPAPVETTLPTDAATTPDHIRSAQSVNEWRQKRLQRVK